MLPWWLADSQTQDRWFVVVLGYVALIIGVALWEQHRVRRWWPMVNELRPWRSLTCDSDMDLPCTRLTPRPVSL